MQESAPITRYLPLIKKTHLNALKKLHIETTHDLLYHFPSRYTDAAEAFDGTFKKGQETTCTGTIEKINMRRTGGKKRLMIAEATLYAGAQKIRAVWFNQPYIAKQYSEGDIVQITGKITGEKSPYVANPIIKHATQEKSTASEDGKDEDADLRRELIAIYPETKGISSLWFRTNIEKVLAEEGVKKMKDPIPEEVRTRLRLPSRYNAFIYIHKPTTQKEHEAARKRFLFEQTLALQVTQQTTKNSRLASKAYNLSIDTKKTDTFMRERFEFAPTEDQKKAVTEILKDIHKNQPMSRLLEGDVGSGKTAVAAAIMHGVVTATAKEKTSGKPQCAYLAPTEILAKQQFDTLIQLFNHLPLKIGLISSKECLKYPSKVDTEKPTKITKTQLKKWIASGELAIVVGTHAIIQKNIQFKRLALVIIDEQHRFGVAQRQKLIDTTDTHIPHLLSMTATPIPRTLALTVYGDLDISIIEEMPKGRKAVKTKLLSTKNIQKAYDHVHEEIKKGHQAYILCPRIQESEESDLRSVEEEYEHLSTNIFPDLTIDSIHGKMKPKEKQEAMEQFNSGKTDILVCTTVVEVGMNVPNATIITILHAERFGLAQLHQLRGRVIRSNHQPYCYAITDSKNEQTLHRLKIFESTHNGFTLAQKDLDNRGSGELAGLRQSGIPDLVMEGLKNQKLTALAQKEAAEIVETDPTLKNHTPLKHYLQRKRIHNE